MEDQRVLADVLGLALADEPDIEVVGVADSAAAAERLAAARKPDVVLMDYHLPDRDGIAASREIHRVRPDVPIVVLTADTSDEALLVALNAGVSGFLIKNEPFTELMSTVRRAAAGEILWPADRLAALLTRTRGEPFATHGRALTRREKDVLRLMSEGLDNKTIAHRLGLSLTTVRGYVQEILRKLGAHSKLEAVVVASRSGLLQG